MALTEGSQVTSDVTLTVGAPLTGAVVALAAVPDPVFAGAIVGPGLAIDPDAPGGLVTAAAPISGHLVKVKPHAFVITGSDGRAVLVHLGIDTVKLGGAGFTIVAAEGTDVHAGDPVIRFDPSAVRAAGLSAVCPVIALEAGAVSEPAAGHVTAGDALFTWA